MQGGEAVLGKKKGDNYLALIVITSAGELIVRVVVLVSAVSDTLTTCLGISARQPHNYSGESHQI